MNLLSDSRQACKPPLEDISSIYSSTTRSLVGACDLLAPMPALHSQIKVLNSSQLWTVKAYGI